MFQAMHSGLQMIMTNNRKVEQITLPQAVVDGDWQSISRKILRGGRGRERTAKKYIPFCVRMFSVRFRALCQVYQLIKPIKQLVLSLLRGN